MMRQSESVNLMYTIVKTRFREGTTLPPCVAVCGSSACMPTITLTPAFACGGENVLYTYTAPAVIVYDFACKLYEYCMNRDPAFFMKTQFLVDRFHLKNHNCAASFKVSTYGELAGLNTQVAEQRNSQTAIVQRLFSYMNPRTFLPSLRLVLYNQNLEKIKSLKTT